MTLARASSQGGRALNLEAGQPDPAAIGRAEALLGAIDRPDAAQNNVRQQAYEALISVVSTDKAEVKLVDYGISCQVRPWYLYLYGSPEHVAHV